jgi:hypothetical protein
VASSTLFPNDRCSDGTHTHTFPTSLLPPPRYITNLFFVVGTSRVFKQAVLFEDAALNSFLFSLCALVLFLFRPNPLIFRHSHFRRRKTTVQSFHVAVTLSPLFSLDFRTSRLHHFSPTRSLSPSKLSTSMTSVIRLRFTLLTNIRFAFSHAERAPYSQLRDTANSELNNVRQEFHSATRIAGKAFGCVGVKSCALQLIAKLFKNLAVSLRIPCRSWWERTRTGGILK